MKREDGFITMFTLIVMSLTTLFVSYLQFTTFLEIKMVAATQQDIQASYNSEIEMFLPIYDKKCKDEQLMPILFDVFRGKKFGSRPSFKLDGSGFGEENINTTINISFSDKESRKQMTLETYKKTNGNTKKSQCNLFVVNELFEIEKAILNSNDIEDIYDEEIISLLDSIESDISLENANIGDAIYGFETNNYQDIVLDTNKSNKTINCSIDTMNNPYKEAVNKREVVILARKYKEKPVNFYISNSNKVEESSLSGIIYVEGDINVLTDFRFNGIMIINGGDLKGDITISGMIIYINSDLSSDNEGVNVVYNKNNLYKYGTYIPGFIDIEMELIKIN